MKYKTKSRKGSLPKRLLIILLVSVAILAAAAFAVRQIYYLNLEPVDTSVQTSQLFEVELGDTVDEIAKGLEDAGLIRSSWAFTLYVSSKQARSDLQAGTYSLSPSQSVEVIVAQLTHGKVATDTVTILPGQRLDQVREGLVVSGLDPSKVDNALRASNYSEHPALVDKPAGASLEGYLYPETFQKTDATTAEEVVISSLDEMQKRLTPDLRSAFANQGLSVYEGITLASIVEKESSNQQDRDRIAQVLLKRLELGMRLQADPTAFYGAILDGQEPSLDYPSPYNTYQHAGLPPGPISNVSESSLMAVANPANTDWLYFVAGDDGKTHFSETLDQHEQNIQQYCKELCQ